MVLTEGSLILDYLQQELTGLTIKIKSIHSDGSVAFGVFKMERQVGTGATGTDAVFFWYKYDGYYQKSKCFYLADPELPRKVEEMFK